ncbi:MAG: phage tail protein [Brevundimonas sp.]
MSKVAKWIFPAAGGKDGIVGTAKAVVGFLTGNAGMVMDGFRQVMGAGKKGDAQARQASILTLTLGETPREAVLGVACTAGSLVDVFNFGGQYGTDKVTRCVALADHAIDGIVGFYINEVYYPWVGEGLQAAFSNKLSLHFRNALPDGYDPPEHVRDNSDWDFTDRLASITHMWVDWYVDDKVWPQGHPEIRFVLRGLRVYDPRFDPQFGYAGPNPQTWADRSSHRFSRNAKVLRYAYTRGIFAEGHHGDPAYLLIGRGLTEEEAPADLVIADANLCDEIVDGVARYCADGVISAAQTFIEVDGMFAAAMAGVIVQREGTVDVEAGQAKAVVATFTDADLVIGEKVGFSRFLGDQDGGRLNTFIGRYIEPLMGWKDHSAPVLRDLDDVRADGGPREATVSLALVTEVKQALRVMEINRLLARLERRGTVVLPPRFAGLEEGDWVAWQSARRHKGATFIYRIEAYREPETWRKYLTLRQISATVFGGVDTIADQASPPPPPQVIDALSLSGVQVEPITLPGERSVIPALRFRWDVPVDAAVGMIRAEVRIMGETDIAPTSIDNVETGLAIVTSGVAAGRLVQGRLVPIGSPYRPVIPSPWLAVSTGELVAGDLAPGAPTAILAAQNTDLIAAEMLRGALYRSYTDGLLYLDGQPVATLFQSLSEQVIDDLGSFAGTLDLLGATNTAGTGFIMNADSVFLPSTEGGGQVQSLRSLQLTTTQNVQEIQELQTLTDGFASSSTLLVVNDVITGIVNQNDGSVGSLLFQADVLAFADPNGGVVTYPFSYGLDNVLRLRDTIVHGDLVVEGTLTNAALVRNTITGMVVADTPGVVTLTGVTAKLVQEVWIAVQNQNSPVKVMFAGLVLMLHNPSGSFTAIFELRRSTDASAGISLRSWQVDATGDTYDAVSGTYTFHLQDEPGPGNWRYFFTMRSTASNMTTQQVTDPYMEAIEYRTNEV